MYIKTESSSDILFRHFHRKWLHRFFCNILIFINNVNDLHIISPVNGRNKFNIRLFEHYSFPHRPRSNIWNLRFQVKAVAAIVNNSKWETRALSHECTNNSTFITMSSTEQNCIFSLTCVWLVYALINSNIPLLIRNGAHCDGTVITLQWFKHGNHFVTIDNNN